MRPPLTFLVLLGLLLTFAPAAAQTEPVPLNDHERLGQRFRADKPWVGVWVSVPSWSDNEGGLALTVWDSPERKRKLGTRTMTGIRDNERIELRLAGQAPAGTYYWEVHARTGQTRIGLYADALTGSPTLCAYIDGVPDPRRRFLSGVVPADLSHLKGDAARLTATLRSSAPLQEKLDACRLLAVLGGPGSVPTLAALLTDPKLAHMARFAMEPVPGPEADTAFRRALRRTRGALQVGVINSIAERGDPSAVPLLLPLLRSSDSAVAAASAVALGRIGTPAAAAALTKALGPGKSAPPPGLAEGALRCAGSLLARGDRGRARALYGRLRAVRVPSHTRQAALRGAMLAYGDAGLGELLLPSLPSRDEAAFRAALGVAQHDLPGARVTRALATLLPALPPGRRALLVDAIAHRRDAAAAAPVAGAAAAGPLDVRLAAVRALPALGARAAVPALVPLLGDADPQVAAAAREVLVAMPPAHVSSSAGMLLGARDIASQRQGIDLVTRMRMAGFGPQVLVFTRSPSAEVRQDALRALTAIGGTAQLPGLLDAMTRASTDTESDAAEQAVSAVCGKAVDREAAADVAASRWQGAPPAVRVRLVRILSATGGARALRAVREGLANSESDGAIRVAALQALCEWRTPDAAPDLLRHAQLSSNPAEVAQCLRGLLRLATDSDAPGDQRLALCRDAQKVVRRDEDKRLLLGALGAIGTAAALELVLPYLDDAAVREEAAAAIVSVGDRLAGTPEGGQARAALERVAAGVGGPDLAARARTLLGKLQP